MRTFRHARGSRIARTWTALGSCIFAAACADGDPHPPLVVQDSGGVVIVESGTPAIAEGSWSLASEPRVSIGVVEGAPDYVFTRIQSVGFLPGGRIYVAQLGNPPQVRIYDAQGGHVRSIGRAGEGPGELSGIAWADLLGEDTIRVYDFWASRITHFGLDGEVLREIPLRMLAGRPAQSISASPGFSAGDLLARSNLMVERDAPRGEGRSTSFLLRIGQTGELVDSFPPMPNVDYLGTPERNVIIPLGRRSGALAHDSLLYVATGDYFGVQVFGAGGEFHAIHRRAGERRPVTSAHVEALRQQQLSRSGTEEQRRSIERSFLETPVPAQLPTYSRAMIVDDAGNLWVEHYLAPGDTARTWDVFSATGEYVTSMAMPAPFQLKQIRGSEAIGVWTGDFDVESVRIYDLLR